MTVDLENGVTVTAKDQTLIDLYENPNKKNKGKAALTYVRESQTSIKLFVCFSSAVIVAGSAATGAAIGTVIGGSLGTYVEPGVGTRVGMYVGGGLGGLAGTAVGASFAKRTIMVIIPRTKFFARWKRHSLKEDLYPMFEKLLKENVFSGLICPITAELPVVPVQAPCGHIYEQEAIEEWLNTRKKGSRYCTLGCEKPFTVYDLMYSEDHLRKIMKAASVRIKELKAQNDKNSRYLASGLDSHIQDTCSVSHNVFSGIVKDEIQSSLDRGFDEKRFLESAKQLYRQERSMRQQKLTL